MKKEPKQEPKAEVTENGSEDTSSGRGSGCSQANSPKAVKPSHPCKFKRLASCLKVFIPIEPLVQKLDMVTKRSKF